MRLAKRKVGAAVVTSVCQKALKFGASPSAKARNSYRCHSTANDAVRFKLELSNWNLRRCTDGLGYVPATELNMIRSRFISVNRRQRRSGGGQAAAIKRLQARIKKRPAFIYSSFFSLFDLVIVRMFAFVFLTSDLIMCVSGHRDLQIAICT